MQAIEKLDTEARKLMSENGTHFPTLERARREARRRDPALSERADREKASEVGRPAPARKLARTATYLETHRRARERMERFPGRFASIEAAAGEVRELDPTLKLREYHEPQRFVEDDVTDKLRDSEREAANEGRAHREVDTAFVEQHVAAIQRRVDNGADTEIAIADEMRATVFPAFRKLVKGGKAKAASSNTKALAKSFLGTLNAGHGLDVAIRRMVKLAS